MKKEMTIDTLWQLLIDCQNQTFYTMKKLPFHYSVKGGEIFVDRRSKSITKATFKQALHKLEAGHGTITGPKSLNVFGAPYVWAILKTFELV